MRGGLTGCAECGGVVPVREGDDGVFVVDVVQVLLGIVGVVCRRGESVREMVHRVPGLTDDDGAADPVDILRDQVAVIPGERVR